MSICHVIIGVSEYNQGDDTALMLKSGGVGVLADLVVVERLQTDRTVVRL